MSPISRSAMGLGLVAVMLAGTALPAAADVAPAAAAAPVPSTSATPRTAPPPGPALNGPLGARLERRADRLCERAAKAGPRIDRAVARISGDATTRGSVLWLRAKADQVRATDPTLAGLLESRAQIREARLPVLKLRRQELPKVTAWCDAHDHPAGG